MSRHIRDGVLGARRLTGAARLPGGDGAAVGVPRGVAAAPEAARGGDAHEAVVGVAGVGVGALDEGVEVGAGASVDVAEAEARAIDAIGADLPHRAGGIGDASVRHKRKDMEIVQVQP